MTLAVRRARWAVRSRRRSRRSLGGALIADSFEAASRIAPTVAVSGGDARGRRVPRQARGHRRREDRVARHPRDQARDQGTARKDRLRPGRLSSALIDRDRRLRTGDGARDGGDCRTDRPKFHRQEKAIVGVQGQSRARARRRGPPSTAQSTCVGSEINRVEEEIARPRRAAGGSARIDRAARTSRRLRRRSALAETQRRLGGLRVTPPKT